MFLTIKIVVEYILHIILQHVLTVEMEIILYMTSFQCISVPSIMHTWFFISKFNGNLLYLNNTVHIDLNMPG